MSSYNERVSRRLLEQYVLRILGSAGALLLLQLLCTVFFNLFGFWRRSVILTYLLYWCRDYKIGRASCRERV